MFQVHRHPPTKVQADGNEVIASIKRVANDKREIFAVLKEENTANKALLEEVLDQIRTVTLQYRPTCATNIVGDDTAFNAEDIKHIIEETLVSENITVITLKDLTRNFQGTLVSELQPLLDVIADLLHRLEVTKTFERRPRTAEAKLATTEHNLSEARYPEEELERELSNHSLRQNFPKATKHAKIQWMMRFKPWVQGLKMWARLNDSPQVPLCLIGLDFREAVTHPFLRIRELWGNQTTHEILLEEHIIIHIYKLAAPFDLNRETLECFKKENKRGITMLGVKSSEVPPRQIKLYCVDNFHYQFGFENALFKSLLTHIHSQESYSLKPREKKRLKNWCSSFKSKIERLDKEM
jgi:hypothetical protein